MIKISFTNVNPNKLHDELIAEGVVPIKGENDKKEGSHIAENTWLTFKEDVDMVLVHQIIDAHEPTPLPQRPSEIEQLRLEQAQANAEIVELIFGMMGGGM